MKTFYIPTSSQNFNGIFSSESLSPKNFYDKRNFGYRRWTSIPENPFGNSILLYDKLKSFVRPKSDIEDYPMLIQIAINDELEKSLKVCAEGIYSLDRTIYIDPFSTRIIFFSEEAKRVVLSISDSSLETKMLKLYTKRISVVSPSAEIYNLPDSSKELQELNILEIEKDKKVNRMKGLLYGYYIGHSLSSDAQHLEFLNTLVKIRDIFASILASIDSTPTQAQIQQLKFLFSKYNKGSRFYQELLEIEPDEIKLDRILSVVRLHHGSHFNGELCPEQFLSELTSKNRNLNEENSSIKWIEQQISSKLLDIREATSPLQSDKEPIVVYETELKKIDSSILSKKEIDLCIFLINGILSSGKYDRNISPVKNELSDDITILVKEFYGDQWEGSSERAELNAIRKHVRGEEYNHEWRNDLYSYLAAVLTKGDDWETLLSFLQSKMITDCTIPFAIYGTLNGFANMSRCLVDVLLEKVNKDRDYIAQVYKEFYGQLFGYEPCKLTYDTSEDTTEIVNKPEPVKQVEKQTEILEEKDNGFGLFWANLIKACKGVVSDKPIYFSLYSKFGLTNEFLDAICNIRTLNKGKGIQSTAKKSIEKQLINKSSMPKNKINHKESDRILGLFDGIEQSTGLFINDFDFLINNQEFKNLVSQQKSWKTDLKWFLDAHIPNKPGYRYYKGKPADNETLIRQYIHFKENIYSVAEQFLLSTYLKNE